MMMTREAGYLSYLKKTLKIQGIQEVIRKKKPEEIYKTPGQSKQKTKKSLSTIKARNIMTVQIKLFGPTTMKIKLNTTNKVWVRLRMQQKWMSRLHLKYMVSTKS